MFKVGDRVKIPTSNRYMLRVLKSMKHEADYMIVYAIGADMVTITPEDRNSYWHFYPEDLEPYEAPKEEELRETMDINSTATGRAFAEMGWFSKGETVYAKGDFFMTSGPDLGKQFLTQFKGYEVISDGTLMRIIDDKGAKHSFDNPDQKFFLPRGAMPEVKEPEKRAFVNVPVGFEIKVMENPMMEDGIGVLMLSPNSYKNYTAEIIRGGEE